MSLTERYADRIETADDGSVTLTLRQALRSPDGDVAFLGLQRPLLDDLLAKDRQPGDDLDRVGWLMAKLSGVSVGAFDGIDAEDALVLAEVVGGFLDRLEDADGVPRQPGDLVRRHADRIVTTESGATLTLRSALATRDGEAAEITLRRPTFREFKAQKGPGTLASAVKMIATLSGIGPLTLGRIDGLDGLILGEIVSGFLGNSPTSGGR